MNDPAGAHEGKAKMSSGRSMYWGPAERMPLDLFSYIREALHCFDESRFLASIAMASSAVELILNRDRRLRALLGFQRRHSWVNLNNKNLRIARQNGLPADALLSADDDLDSHTPIAFVELRNKVAHGEIKHLIKDLSDFDPIAAQLAMDQESKMRRFVSEWFNTAPDVQQGYIRDYQWPS